MDVDQLLQAMNAFDMSSLRGDEVSRLRLMRGAAAFFGRVETPAETVLRFRFKDPGTLCTMKIAIDMGLYKILANGNQSLETLASASHADIQLVKRVVRACAAAIHSPSILEVNNDREGKDGDLYALNDLGRALAEDDYAGTISNLFEQSLPVYSKLPAFLAATQYRNPDDQAYGPSHFAHGLDRGANMWAATLKDPKVLKNFNLFLSVASKHRPSWTRSLDPRALLSRSLRSDKPLVVDVGGATGVDLAMFRESCPEAEGRLILQDLPHVIKDARKARDLDGLRIEAMEHDFFRPQPITGARIYFLGSVLHDWQDAQCKQILDHIHDAMDKEYSTLLLHECAMPDRGADAGLAGLDVNMMLLPGRERSLDEWKVLLQDSGFVLKAFHKAPEAARGLIEAVRSDSTKSKM